TGVMMKAGSQFTFSVHLHSIGKEVKVRLDVALKFRPKTFKPRFNQQIFTFVGDSEEPELDIPANTDKVRFDAYFTMPKNGLITTFEPHMHSSGNRMCVELIYPDSTAGVATTLAPPGKREMMNCAAYNHNWVKVYTYEEDVAPILPKGTIL